MYILVHTLSKMFSLEIKKLYEEFRSDELASTARAIVERIKTGPPAGDLWNRKLEHDTIPLKYLLGSPCYQELKKHFTVEELELPCSASDTWFEYTLHFL